MAKNPRFTNYIKDKYPIDLSDLKELLRTNKVESNTLNLISCLFEIASYGMTDSLMLSGIALGIKYAVESIRDNCSIDEKNWNPKKVANGTEFKPFLLSSVSDIVKDIDDKDINTLLKNT